MLEARRKTQLHCHRHPTCMGTEYGTMQTISHAGKDTYKGLLHIAHAICKKPLTTPSTTFATRLPLFSGTSRTTAKLHRRTPAIAETSSASVTHPGWRKAYDVCYRVHAWRTATVEDGQAQRYHAMSCSYPRVRSPRASRIPAVYIVVEWTVRPFDVIPRCLVPFPAFVNVNFSVVEAVV